MTPTPRICKLIFPLLFAAACYIASANTPARAENYESWGLGYGMSYAYLGANLDYRLMPNLYLVGAVGSGVYQAGLALGGRYYLLPTLFETARVRVSVMYGPSSGVVHTPVGTDSTRYQDFAGFALGLGILMFGDSEGFDFDIFYTNTRPAKRRFERYAAAGDSIGYDGLDPLNVSLGYRRRF